MSVRVARRALAAFVSSALIAVGFVVVGAAAAPTAAFASSYSIESQFVARTNAVRQANGLAPYSVASDLVSVARGHSAAMASSQSLYHNPSLTTQVNNWQVVGENVGEGPTVDDLQTAFMNSSEHRANILDREYTQVGVGVSVDRSGIIWVTLDFRLPMGSSASSTPSRTTSHATSPSSSPSSYTPSSSPSVVSHPQPTLSPRAILMQRLHQIRQHHHVKRHADAVSQSFDYVTTLSRLTA